MKKTLYILMVTVTIGLLFINSPIFAKGLGLGQGGCILGGGKW